MEGLDGLTSVDCGMGKNNAYQEEDLGLAGQGTAVERPALEQLWRQPRRRLEQSTSCGERREVHKQRSNKCFHPASSEALLGFMVGSLT